jgi:hypothetical protein
MITMSRTTETQQEDSEKGPVVFPDPIALVFEEALGKFHQGAVKYGTFDPAADRRDFIRETEAEILYSINYLAMFLLKVRAIREQEPSRKNSL